MLIRTRIFPTTMCCVQAHAPADQNLCCLLEQSAQRTQGCLHRCWQSKMSVSFGSDTRLGRLNQERNLKKKKISRTVKSRMKKVQVNTHEQKRNSRCGPLLAEDYRKARKEVSDIVIAPLTRTRQKAWAISLAASMLVYSVNKKRLVKVKENDREVYIEIAPHDTVLTLSHEYLVVDGDIAGTFHSKVRCSAMGLGNVSTTLDPNWRGKLLFSLNNPTKRKIKLVIEEKNDGDRKAVGLITMVLYRIAGKEEHITAKRITFGQSTYAD